MRLSIWRYELTRLGWPALLGVPLAMLAIGVLAMLTQFAGIPRQVNAILSNVLDVLPVVAGIGAAGAVRVDNALELQLSLPTPYRTTACRRLALTLVWTALLTLAASSWLALSNRLIWPISFPADQLIWLPPLLWLAAAGATLTLGLRAFAIGSGLVAVLWVLERSFSDLFAAPPLQTVWLFLRYVSVSPAAWYLNRGVLLLTAAVLFLVAFWLLGRTERLLGSEP
jgi:hypothetical protein